MSVGELLLTLLVTLLVFGPQKLPILARDLGRFFAKCQRLKQQFLHLWNAEQQLTENENKACAADKLYNEKADNK